MLGLYLSLAALGLAAVDPVGIGAMPVLLVQKHPYGRSWTFLSGSFASLVVMGWLCAKGLGAAVLHFERNRSWFVPTVELAGGLILLTIAGTAYWQGRRGKLEKGPSDRILNMLSIKHWQLFLAGAALVAVQSVFDVVFVIAMVRTGQYHLSNLALALAVVIYAAAALVLQAAVIGAFYFAPASKKRQTLAAVRLLLGRYANLLLIAVSLLLGCALLIIAA